jgi:hypothetical protein
MTLPFARFADQENFTDMQVAHETPQRDENWERDNVPAKGSTTKDKQADIPDGDNDGAVDADAVKESSRCVLLECCSCVAWLDDFCT